MEGSSDQNLDVEAEVKFVELILQAHDVQVDADALQRVRRILQGSLTRDQARAEIAFKYGRLLP